MSRAIDSENLYKFLTDQCVTGTGAFAKGVNKGLNIARSAVRNEQIAPTLTPQNEWISVEDRLPEEGQIVLVHQKDGFIYCAENFAGNVLMSPGWFIDNYSWDAKEVTHWMPLPEPPEGKDGDANRG